MFLVLALLLALLLHLLSALVVGSLLVRAPALLGLLLFDALALLILLSPHVLQLLLMLQLKLRIAIRRRIVRRPSCRRSSVWPVIAGRPVRLHIIRPLGVRRRRVGPLRVRRTIRLIRLHIIGPLRVRRRRGRPIILLNVARLLHRTIHVLWRRRTVPRFLRHRRHRPRGGSDPALCLRVLLLLDLPYL